MGAGAILKMVEYAFCHHCFIMDEIVSYDDSTMQAVLKHQSIGAHGEVMRSPKGKIDEEIPVPSFLADPSYCVKVVSKHIFSIVDNDKSQRCGCTKADTIRLNKCWGYMIKKNRHKSLEELQHASKVTLEHMFNNHDKCSA